METIKSNYNEVINVEESVRELNQQQDKYVNQIVDRIHNVINGNIISSDIQIAAKTGSGKTKIIHKLVDKLPNFFFYCTTLSTGSLAKDLSKELLACPNCEVRGLSSITKATKTFTKEIETQFIKKMKAEYDYVVWIRDESDYGSTIFESLLNSNYIDIVINFTATPNKPVDIKIDYTDSAQNIYRENTIISSKNFNDGIGQLKIVKKAYADKGISKREYNPLMIVSLPTNTNQEARVLEIMEACEKAGLKVISILDEVGCPEYLKVDNCDVDVIINCHKISRGVDIPRAQIFYKFLDSSKEISIDKTSRRQEQGRVIRHGYFWYCYHNHIQTYRNDNYIINVGYIFYNNKGGVDINDDEEGNEDSFNRDIQKGNYADLLRLPLNTCLEVDGGKIQGKKYFILENFTGRIIIKKGYCDGRIVYNYSTNEPLDYYLSESCDTYLYLSSFYYNWQKAQNYRYKLKKRFRRYYKVISDSLPTANYCQFNNLNNFYTNFFHCIRANKINIMSEVATKDPLTASKMSQSVIFNNLTALDNHLASNKQNLIQEIKEITKQESFIMEYKNLSLLTRSERSIFCSLVEKLPFVKRNPEEALARVKENFTIIQPLLPQTHINVINYDSFERERNRNAWNRSMALALVALHNARFTPTKVKMINKKFFFILEKYAERILSFADSIHMDLVRNEEQEVGGAILGIGAQPDFIDGNNLLEIKCGQMRQPEQIANQILTYKLLNINSTVYMFNPIANCFVKINKNDITVNDLYKIVLN